MALRVLFSAACSLPLRRQPHLPLRALCVKSSWATRHVIVSATNSPLLSSVVAEELEISVDNAIKIIAFGSVYLNENPETNNAPTKRCMTDAAVKEGSYVRVYPDAGRYDVDSVDWRQTIVHENDDFVVVNKPAGIPCNPTAANFHENVLESVRRALGCGALFNPHRLDVGTSGILVLGKTKAFATEFGNAIKRREVTKVYKLVVVNSFKWSDWSADLRVNFPAEGSSLTHYMETSKHYPKVLHDDKVPGSKVCISEVVAVSPTEACSNEEWRRRSEGDPPLQEALRCWGEQAAAGGHDALALCEVRLRLLTGRTHQLRAQVLATGHGNAIAGDAVYSPHCFAALLRDERLRGKNPEDPSLIHAPWLALQACQIEAAGVSRVLGARRHSLAHAFWSPLFRKPSPAESIFH